MKPLLASLLLELASLLLEMKSLLPELEVLLPLPLLPEMKALLPMPVVVFRRSPLAPHGRALPQALSRRRISLARKGRNE